MKTTLDSTITELMKVHYALEKLSESSGDKALASMAADLLEIIGQQIDLVNEM